MCHNICSTICERKVFRIPSWLRQMESLNHLTLNMERCMAQIHPVKNWSKTWLLLQDLCFFFYPQYKLIESECNFLARPFDATRVGLLWRLVTLSTGVNITLRTAGGGEQYYYLLRKHSSGGSPLLALATEKPPGEWRVCVLWSAAKLPINTK